VIKPTRTGNHLNGSASPDEAGFSPAHVAGGKAFDESSPSQVSRPQAAGRTTVWNMIASAQQQARKQMIYGMAAVALVAGLLAWKFWPKTPVLSAGCEAKCVAEKFGATTVKIDVTWKLISPSGGLVYHQYVLNQKDKDSDEKLIPGGPSFIPLYVKVDSQTIEPYLSYDGNKFSVPIGGSHSGTGFFVSSNGFILTNRHVAATWEQVYEFPDSANIGFVYAADKKTPIGVIRQAPDGWIPAKTRQEFGSFKGFNDKLEVALPGSSLPVRADLKRVSDRHDVALIKMDMPEAAPMVEINDNHDTIKEGEAITILGYPSVTAPIFGFIRSAEDSTRGIQRVIPRITVTPGNVGAVLRDSGEGNDRLVSRLGDVYQLTANATGAGNSGGPVFDDQGRVIGIFYAGRRYGGATVTYAVPIRYGKDLMSLK
jgi:S1-C subfamily serine protease